MDLPFCLPFPIEDLRALVGRVDTARHHDCTRRLRARTRSVPPETTGFDPLTVLTGGGRPMALRCGRRDPPCRRGPPGSRADGRVRLPPSPAGAVPGAAGGHRGASVRSSRRWPWAETLYQAPCPTIWLRRSGGLDAALGCGAGRLRHQRHIPARRPAQGGHRGASSSPGPNTSRRQAFHRGWLHRRPPRSSPRGCWTLSAEPGVAGGRQSRAISASVAVSCRWPRTTRRDCGHDRPVGFATKPTPVWRVVGVEKVHRNPVARKQAQMKSRRGCTWRAKVRRHGADAPSIDSWSPGPNKRSRW